MKIGLSIHSLVALSLLAQACGSGKWVDAPGLCERCEGVSSQMHRDFSLHKDERRLKECIDTAAQSTCGRAGKSFTGKTDCEQGHNRVQCE